MSQQQTTTSLPTATWAHRVLALLIDWVACTLVVVAVLSSVALGGFMWETVLATHLLNFKVLEMERERAR